MNTAKKSLLLSIFINGLGQFLVCKQKAKGLFFMMMQFIFIGIELATGYWLEFFSGQVAEFQLRLHGGFFSRGIWGLITLGDIPGAKIGDHSTMLLISGVIVILLIGIFGSIYVWGIIDAYKTGKEIDITGKCKSSKQYFKETYSKMFAYVVLAPIAVLILFVTVMPIVFSVLTAFTNYGKGHIPPGNLVDWVGFENFTKLFNVPIWSSTFFSVLKWTVIWAVIATFSCYFLGLFQAMILNHRYVKGKKFFRTILILPWAVPSLISLLVFKNILNTQFGPLNQFLVDMGFITERIPFLTDPAIAKITILCVNLWLGFPMFMVMILGVLSNFDSSVSEAASIDGATKFQEFRHITLPIIMKATMPPLLMSLVANFNNFGAIYFLTEGGPANPAYQFAGDTDILISWIYKLTLDQQMYSMAAVMSILIFLLVGGISFWNFRRTTAFKEA